MSETAIAPGTLAGPPSASTRDGRSASARRFGLAALALLVLSAALAGWAPLGFSIVTVFLFAGPHNWLEFRFFLSRMPARWGPLRWFFFLAIGGALGLTAAFAALPWTAGLWGGSEGGWSVASAGWNTAFLVWLATLVHLRARERPGRDPSPIWAVCCLLVAGVWAFPAAWEVALVYLHPLVALGFLQRELKRRLPEWLPAYYACLACVPVALGVLWWRLAGTPSLPGEDVLSLRIAQHAGSGILQGISSHLLVSTHTFLEMLHYGVWVVAIPLVAFRSVPWDLRGVPLFRKSSGWSLGIRWVASAGALAVLALWAGFLADYPATRDLYFTLAILHVLMEFPFLLRTV